MESRAHVCVHEASKSVSFPKVALAVSHEVCELLLGLEVCYACLFILLGWVGYCSPPSGLPGLHWVKRNCPVFIVNISDKISF